MLDKIVQYTNEKIGENIKKNGYSPEYLQKHPYIKNTDKVPVLLISYWYHCKIDKFKI
jgi:hypothetical protein